MRIQVTTFPVHISRSTDSERVEGKLSTGVLTIETERVQELDSDVVVARLKTDCSLGSRDVLAPLVDAKITELSESRFALTGVEVHGASRFARAWYCEVRPWMDVSVDSTLTPNTTVASES